MKTLILLTVSLTGVTGQNVLPVVLGQELEHAARISGVNPFMKDWHVQKTRRSPVIEMFHVRSTASMSGVTGPVVFAAGCQKCFQGRVKGLGLGRSPFHLLTMDVIVRFLRIRKRPAGVRLKQELSGQW